ncbi:hypothetical protein PJI17_09425 [Mycobacterium kansasii]
MPDDSLLAPFRRSPSSGSGLIARLLAHEPGREIPDQGSAGHRSTTSSPLRA